MHICFLLDGGICPVTSALPRIQGVLKGEVIDNQLSLCLHPHMQAEMLGFPPSFSYFCEPEWRVKLSAKVLLSACFGIHYNCEDKNSSHGPVPHLQLGSPESPGESCCGLGFL